MKKVTTKKLVQNYLSKISESVEQKYPVGKHVEVSKDQFDSEQLKMGIEVEKEHTDDENIALEIAKDHLAEIPIYYTLLLQMEKDYRKKKV